MTETKIRFFKGDFLITKDVIGEGHNNRYSNRDEPEAIEKIKVKGKKFRLLDDDGNIYFYSKGLTDFGENAFNPLDRFGGPGYGCTDIQYKNAETGEWESL